MLAECYAVLMQHLRRRFSTALLFSLCLSSFAQDSTFKSQTQLVVVPVTVADKNGNRVWDLKESDFVLLDNTHERKITVEPWGTYESRVSLVVVVETSFLSDAALVRIRKMASMLSDITGENGEIAVITADSGVHSLLDFTTEWEPLRDAIAKLHPSTDRAGHILDGLSAGVVLLEHRPQNRRRIILLLCEGHDRGSHSHPMDVLTFAEKENVIIYTVNYSPFLTPFTVKDPPTDPTSPNNPTKAPSTVAMNSTIDIAPITLDAAPGFEEVARSFKFNIGKTLANYTGGRELGFATDGRLEKDLASLTAEVHSQYQISFAPPEDKTPIYHQIEVQVKNRPDLMVHARPGYWVGVPVNAKPLQPAPVKQ